MPWSEARSPVMILRKVVFPEPLGPTTPRRSPRSTCKSTELKSDLSPKRLEIPWTTKASLPERAVGVKLIFIAAPPCWVGRLMRSMRASIFSREAAWVARFPAL